jgi:hypothetical protein
MKRLFTTSTRPLIPLCSFGWHFKDTRTRSGIAVGNAFFDGNVSLSWDHYEVSVRQAMTSSLAYLMGKENLPAGMLVPFTTDGRFLHHTIHQVAMASRERLDMLTGFPPTIFTRQYDVICPLPTSHGPAESPSLHMASTIAKT